MINGVEEIKKSNVGRKKIQLDWEQFDKLCGLQCTLREIASYFDCSEDTIERRCKEDKSTHFADYKAQKAGKGRIGLRRKQYELAMAGDKTMLIWLGKQYLGQSDKQETALTETIQINIDSDDSEL